MQVNIPIPSMYGIFTYIYHTNQPNVGRCTIHGSYGIYQSHGCYVFFRENSPGVSAFSGGRSGCIAGISKTLGTSTSHRPQIASAVDGYVGGVFYTPDRLFIPRLEQTASDPFLGGSKNRNGWQCWLRIST